jgi:toxin YoeB
VDVLWAPQASEDFDFWLAKDAKVADRIKALIADIKTQPFAGIGKPEPLKHDWSGYWSRRITGEHRLVYRVEGKPSVLTIAQCRYHYE